MSSTPNIDTVVPDAVLAARADERFTRAYEQIARADEQLARVTEQLSKLENDAVQHHPSAFPDRRQASGRPMRRAFVGLLFAALIGAAAFAAQSPYGETARQTMAEWAPQLVSTSSSWLAKPASFAQPNQPGAQLAGVETTAALPAASAQALAQDTTPAPAPMSPELAQMLQSMAHDIATVEQGIEQLKANQEQMAADNARVIEQLKASQEQMARLVAKPVEQAKTPVPPARPVAANTAPKPKPAQPPQARAHPQPVQLQPKQQ